jgi:hypothetical protein
MLPPQKTFISFTRLPRHASMDVDANATAIDLACSQMSQLDCLRRHATVFDNRVQRAARFTQLALIDGTVGLILAPHGHLTRAVVFKIVDDKIVEADVIADRARLSQLELGVID